MAMLFSDGFDYTQFSARTLNGKYASSSGSITTGGRFGGACQSGATGNTKALSLSGVRVLFGVWMQMNGAPGLNRQLVMFYNAADSQGGGLIINATGQLCLNKWMSFPYSADVVLYSTAISDNVWHWVEADITFASGTGGSYTVYVDGVQVATATGVSTYTSGTIAIDHANLCTTGMLIDDIVIWDNSGSGLTAADFPLGPMRCQRISPASGVTTNWTRSSGSTSYNLVNEANPDTSSYIESTTVSQAESWAYGSITGTPIAIKGVAVSTYAINPLGGLSTFKATLKTGGTTYDGATNNTPSAYSAFTDYFDLSPNTGAEWTASNVNAINAGVTLLSSA